MIRWRTINFWTFLICCRDVPLGYEIKCKSGWAQKQIAACNLLSVRLITYIFIFSSIPTQSWTPSIERSYILGFHCPSQLFSHALEQDKRKFSWDLRKSFKKQQIACWATPSRQTDCLNSSHRAHGSSFSLLLHWWASLGAPGPELWKGPWIYRSVHLAIRFATPSSPPASCEVYFIKSKLQF